MSSLWQTIVSLTAAASLMVSGAVREAAPHQADGELMLVNRQWYISGDYTPELRTAKVNGQLRELTPEASLALEELFAACRQETGCTLTSVSGYRPYDKQVRIYNNKLKRVHNSVEETDKFVARPGASEHQTGLSIDIGQKNAEDSNLGASFSRTRGGRWIRENSWRFGFILRYDEGWESITGYEYEPWHIRYVGKEAAARIRNQMPLEVFLQDYRVEVLLRLIGADELPVPAQPLTVLAPADETGAPAEEAPEDYTDIPFSGLMRLLIPSACAEDAGWDDFDADIPWVFDLPDGYIDPSLLLPATAAHPLPDGAVPDDLTELTRRRNSEDGINLNGGVYVVTQDRPLLRREAAEALARMLADAEAAGIVLQVRQAWRSWADTKARYDRYAAAGQQADAPGCSDYQTGLAVDLVSREWSSRGLSTLFGSTEEAQWLSANAAAYGFVPRWPLGHEAHTGHSEEPWHYRYVGPAAARWMTENGLCLEEMYALVAELY